MKKILLLGGSTQQIPAIEYAAKQGYYTVLCDYLQDNPGQHYAHVFYCTSTTDKEAVLEVAEKENIDGIVAYASDPAAPTAAYIAEKMGLPTNPFKSVEILATKDLFRQFLINNDFNCPQMVASIDYNNINDNFDKISLPVMVKPVDLSGSKGVNLARTIDEIEKYFFYAMTLSRVKKVIIEEYINKSHKYMVGGDCFVLNGQVVFWGLLNCHRNQKLNPYIPVGKSHPVDLSEEKLSIIKSTVQRVVDLLGLKFGGFNLELMFDKEGKIYLLEMGPRHGGNMIPDLLNTIYGVDLIGATVETALGNKKIDLSYKTNNDYYSTYILHTDKCGILKKITFNREIEKKIVNRVIYKKPGDQIEYFNSADKAIGILFLKHESKDEMYDAMDSADRMIEIVMT